jgi:hypothetical protein
MRQLVHFLTSPVNLAVIVVLCLAACTKDSTTFSELSQAKIESGKVATDWLKLSVELTSETPGYTAPIATRTFAYLGIGIYETVVLGIEGQPSLQGKIQGLQPQSLPVIYEGGQVYWTVAVSECMNSLFKKFYRNAPPAGLKKIQDLYMAQKAYLPDNADQEVIAKSSQFGLMMAEAIYKYSVTDGQEEAFLNNYPTNYSAPKGQGLWAPTSNQIKKPLLPYWGTVRTFSSLTEFTDPVNPPVYSTESNSVFYAYALDVRNRVLNLDDATVNMVRYWNDDQERSLSLAGHMVSILVDLLNREQKDLEFSARAIGKLTMGLHDVTVASWRVKYKYNMLRPETYIREHIDRNFISLISSQSTPEYSASQAAVAMVGSEVLSEIFGYNYAFTDRTHEFRKDIDGTPRAFKSFRHMAEEINMSTLYGGIHYRFSLEAGQKQGLQIGKNINRLTM